MPRQCTKILLYPKLDLDVTVGLFVLIHYGDKQFSGVGKADLEFITTFPRGETWMTLEERGIITLDMGGGRFDHHRMSRSQEKQTVTDLVARYLGIASHPAFRKLFALVRRDDFEGKGILSSDPLDRAFGISATLMNLNRRYASDPRRVITVMHEIIGAHIAEQIKRTTLIPKELEQRRSEGNVVGFQLRQGRRVVKVMMVKSDTDGMVGYLRNNRRMSVDIVVQFRSTGHINLITRQQSALDLSGVAAEIRKAELALKEILITKDLELRLLSKGRLPEVPEWYYDTAANSLQNGGAVPQSTPPSRLSPMDVKRAVTFGLGAVEQSEPRERAHIFAKREVPEVLVWRSSEGIFRNEVNIDS